MCKTASRQARLYRVWNVPEFGTPEQAWLDLTAQVLGGGKTHPGYIKRLVYKDQIANSATASNDAREIAGQFDFTLTANPNGDLKKVEKEADEELQNYLKSGPTETESTMAQDSKSWVILYEARIALEASAARATSSRGARRLRGTQIVTKIT